jgi:hypothetical protein
MFRHPFRVVVLTFAIASAACSNSDPQAPATTASVSGTVVVDGTAIPASGVDVVLQMGPGTGMMMGNDWRQTDHMMTNTDGRFHFEYMNNMTHHYRVGVKGSSDWHMCDWSTSDEDSVVLRVPPPHP